jgi:hypothetical protein
LPNVSFLRSKGMNILRRRVPAVEAGGKEINPAGTVHRRIEVTVEREVVSVLARGKRKGQSPDGAASGSESVPAELPLPREQEGRE